MTTDEILKERLMEAESKITDVFDKIKNSNDRSKSPLNKDQAKDRVDELIEWIQTK